MVQGVFYSVLSVSFSTSLYMVKSNMVMFRNFLIFSLCVIVSVISICLTISILEDEHDAN